MSGVLLVLVGSPARSRGGKEVERIGHQLVARGILGSGFRALWCRAVAVKLGLPSPRCRSTVPRRQPRLVACPCGPSKSAGTTNRDGAAALGF